MTNNTNNIVINANELTEQVLMAWTDTAPANSYILEVNSHVPLAKVDEKGLIHAYHERVSDILNKRWPKKIGWVDHHGEYEREVALKEAWRQEMLATHSNMTYAKTGGEIRWKKK